MNGAKRAIAFITLLAMIFAQVPLPVGAQEPLVLPLLQSQVAVQEPASSSARSEGLIDPATGGEVSLDGVMILLPAGAVKESTRISIRKLSAVEALGEGIANATAGAQGYRFEPHGIKFAKPVTLVVPFDKMLLGSETALSNLYTYFYDDLSRRWERLPRSGIDRVAATITSSSTHFTDMINATLKLPEGPKPIQFDPNSIKKLEAANPGEAVPKPEGPEAGAFGSNSFSIPLRLPQGRGGATPELALRYSSDASNGWLGRGFDIDVPAVTIDTRFGLPKYDGKDSYSLGGEELVPVAGGSASVSLYKRRVEKSFQLIKWTHSSGEDYWEVTDKSGRVREYGRGEGWIGPDRSNRAKVYIWYLTKQRDSFGNTVEYDYYFDRPNLYTYLSRIRYSGHESGSSREAGAFTVDFAREAREDRRIDARGRFPSKMASRLARIDIAFLGSVIRSYLPDYGDYNEFGQSQLRKFSETDGAGAKFYSYDFSYFAMPTRNDGSGSTSYASYDAFGSSPEKMETEAWNVGTEGKYDGLSSSMNASVGGSLALGASFYLPRIWKPWKKRLVANLSVHGSVGASVGGSTSSLLDANGDGLPDLAWRENGNLYAYLNTGSGFDASKPYSIQGMSSVMDKESSYNLSYGASASVAGTGVGVTDQESWSNCETSFADVNGDGLIDFVKAGDTGFDLNVGGSFASTSWRFGEEVGPSGASAYDEAKYQAMYYIEEPTRAWEAWRSGSVEVEQSASSLETRRGRLALCTYAPGSPTEPASVLTLPGPGSVPAKEYSLSPRDRLFFRVNSLGDDRNSGVSWNIKIRYTAIKLFENLRDPAVFDPPRTLPGGTIGALSAIYTYRTPISAPGYYQRKEDWQNSANLDVYRSLADRGFFVAQKVPVDVFAEMLAQAKAEDIGNWLLPDNEDPSGNYPYQLLSLGYGYESETGSFRRMHASDASDPELASFLSSPENQAAIDRAFMRYIASPNVSDSQRESVALSSGVDGEGPVIVSSMNGESWYERSSSAASIAPAIIARDAYLEAKDGQSVEGKGLLLETRTDPISTGSERLWLRLGTQPRIYSEIDGSERELADAVPSLSYGADSLVVGMRDRGMPRSFRYGGKTSLIDTIPNDTYSGELSDYLLAGLSFSTDSFLKIPVASWTRIDGALSDVGSETKISDKKLFEASYLVSADGAYYELDRSIPSATLERILLLLHPLAKNAKSPFDILPGDAAGALRFILVNPTDYAAFIAYAGADFASCFTPFADSSFYYPRASLDQGEALRLLDAMRLYYRDTQAFPYYTFDPAKALWTRIASLTADQAKKVADTLSAYGLSVYGTSTKTIRFSSDTILQVSRTTLPAGALVEGIAPTGGNSEAAGQEVGVAYALGFDAAGKTIFKPRYIHVFDSAGDYSARNLCGSQADYKDARIAYFAGGVYGWYYGLWTGNYDWDSRRLGTTPPQNEAALNGGAVAAPPYYTEAAANTQGSGQVLIALSGRDTIVPVAADAWVGDVSSYSAQTMNDDLTVYTRTFNFAAFVAGDSLYTGRYGGDSYYRVPRSGSSIGGGGSLSFIRKSRSSSLDWNYPGGLSRNESSSWQYCGLMDINGDRYPDLLQFGDSKDGSSSFTVVDGTGQGFGSARSYSLPGNGRLGKNKTTTWSVGASPAAVAGAVVQLFSPKGKPVAATPQPDEKCSTNAGLVASFGSSVQVAGFNDINGDGLPDYLTRDGGGAYGVAINRGDGSFETVDWGSDNISVDAFPGFASLGSIPLEGISHASIGSFGGSLSVTFPLLAKASITVGLTGNTNQTLSNLIDVNGDGLPDIVVKKPGEAFFRVRFNLGDRFADKESRLYRPEWSDDVKNFSLNIGRDLRMLAAGLNGIDLLGTDLSDYIPDLGGIKIPSTGDNPFLAAVNPFQIDDDLEYSTGLSFSLGANASFGFNWWLLELYLSPGLNGSVARTSADLKFTDIDGDGLPDHVLKMPNSGLVYVKRNQMGKVGLLKSMGLPLGGRYEFDYERSGNTTSMPQSRWVLSALTKDDGASLLSGDRGVHRYTETYSYSGGNYDRVERMFLGFDTVRVTKSDGSVATSRYLNADCYVKGISSGGELRGIDERGRKVVYQESSSNIAKLPVMGSLGKQIFFPAVTSETKRRYEAEGSSFVETSTSYDYDGDGNVIGIIEKGSNGDAGETIKAAIRYADNLPGYLRQQPTSIYVTDGNDKSLRYRTGSYGSHGELLTTEEYDSLGSFRRHNLSYDDTYGNPASITDPRGYRISWDYDDVMHGFPTRITRSNTGAGSPIYSSSSTWDYALGKKLSETDENGQTMSYAYDRFGRLTEVRSPYDSGSVAAVVHSYDSAAFPWTATTSNKLLYSPSDDQVIRTIIGIDGLGRVLQTAKEGEYRDSNGARHFGWNLSGAISYDAKGRTIGEGQPQFAETRGSPGLAAMAKATVTSYDALDRVIQKLLPDGASMRSEYLVSGNRLVERSIDPLGNASEKRLDARGNVLAVARLSSSGTLLMSASYGYDAIGQLLAAVDSKGNTVSVAYDLSGRRVSLESADTGKVLLSYDEAGNLVKKTDAVLRSHGQAITYEYDGHERLVKVLYPKSAPTLYLYGDASASNGGVGRLLRRSDESGSVSYEYGKLGETTVMSRTIDRLTPLAGDLSARFEYVSDYLGRLQRITYPDGEIVSYGYDRGGQVNTVKSEHNGLVTTYVADIAYDAFGQRTYIEYGNGVRTSYAYDADRRRLSSIHTGSSFGSVYQALAYRFDLVGNILGYTNNAGGYETNQSYEYDSLYQLTKAEGNSVYRPYGIAEYTSRYNQDFTYDAIGNMTSKQSSSRTSPNRSVGDNLNYSYAYSYYPGKAHQAERIGNQYYRYDGNGNVIEEREGGHGSGEVLAGTVFSSGDIRITDTGFGIARTPGSASGSGGKILYSRSYAWDEENRLIRSVDNSIAVDYRYGADGRRAAKYSKNGESLYFDSMWACQTDYPDLRQMKNIYVGQARIATRLNISGDNSTGYERQNTYYYQSDHLGSAQLVTDYQGKEYERIEYTPYGESWIEKSSNGLELLPYKFTGKELDSETGLYYYGARYMNPKTSNWLSADPALGDYIPSAPTDEEARKRNENLPGMGGVFNMVNLALYHYAGNNPVKYTDPDGKYVVLDVSKNHSTMTVYYTMPGQTEMRSFTLSVVTNVVASGNASTSGIASDATRIQQSQGGPTNPTQLANNTYPMNGIAVPSAEAGNIAPEYKFGKPGNGLSINATQSLPNADDDSIQLPDSGYMIHITSAKFTNGCIGIPYNSADPKSKAAAIKNMQALVELYKATMGKGGDKIFKLEMSD